MPIAERPEPRLPNWLVQNRNFVCLWLAYGIAAMGDHLSEMALLKARGGLERPDATRVQALITFGFFLPFVLLAPLAGWWSDRFSRKYTMIAADLVRAVIVFGMATIVGGLVALLAPTEAPGEYSAWGDLSIVIPLAGVGAIAAFFSPARQALLPTLVREDQLVRANAMINALGTIGAILSAVLGGWMLETFGAQANFHINAGTFLASALFVACIVMSNTRYVPHAPLDGILKPVRAGFAYVNTHRRILGLILLATVFWSAAGVVISVVPAIVKSIYPSSYTAAGTFRGLMAVGLALGATVMTILGPTIPLQLAIMAALSGALFWLLCLAAAAYWSAGAILTGACLIGVGGAGAGLLVSVMAAIQRFVPDQKRGRIFGVSDMTTMGALVLATGLLGLPRIPELDRYVPLLLLITAVGMATALWIAGRRYLRHRDAPRHVALIWLLVRFLGQFWWRARRVGPCTVPRHGAVIVAANHTAGVDPMAMLTGCTYRLISFLVAEEYYNVPVAKQFMRWARCVPIDRQNPGKSFLVNCLRLLKDGGCLGIFPQGTFEAPGEERPEAKSGVGLLALRTGATVIPCHLSGARYFDNPFLAYFVRHRMRVRFGPPVDLSAFRGRERDKSAPDEAAALIMQKIMELAPPPAGGAPPQQA